MLVLRLPLAAELTERQRPGLGKATYLSTSSMSSSTELLFSVLASLFERERRGRAATGSISTLSMSSSELLRVSGVLFGRAPRGCGVFLGGAPGGVFDISLVRGESAHKATHVASPSLLPAPAVSRRALPYSNWIIYVFAFDRYV